MVNILNHFQIGIRIFCKFASLGNRVAAGGEIYVLVRVQKRAKFIGNCNAQIGGKCKRIHIGVCVFQNLNLVIAAAAGKWERFVFLASGKQVYVFRLVRAGYTQLNLSVASGIFDHDIAFFRMGSVNGSQVISVNGGTGCFRNQCLRRIVPRRDGRIRFGLITGTF